MPRVSAEVGNAHVLLLGESVTLMYAGTAGLAVATAHWVSLLYEVTVINAAT